MLYLNFRGSLKCLTGDADGALQDLNAAIRIDARFSRAYRARGAAYLSLGEFEKAALNFQQADELDSA